MYWATTTFRVTPSPDLNAALKAWAAHIHDAHPKISEVRCYRYNGGTEIVWQEGFANFHDYQDLIEQEDDVCTTVMSSVFAHEVPGTRSGRIWSDGL
ncbi:MAG: hypothetical protein NVSMB55_01310 [Mycobacteriales bacterium]